jgi:hypothetical protein
MPKLRCRTGIDSYADARDAVMRVLGMADCDCWIIGGSDTRSILANRITACLFMEAAVSLFPLPEGAVSASCIRLGQIVAKNWDFDWLEDHNWFHKEIEANPRFKGIDLEFVLLQWDAFLEHQAKLRASHRKNCFPSIWKRSLLNFLKKELENAAARAKTPANVPVNRFSWKSEQQCNDIRKKVGASAIGRSDTPEQFEDRVKRVCQRSGVRYSPVVEVKSV